MKHCSLAGDLHCGATTGLTPTPSNATQEALLAQWRSERINTDRFDVAFWSGDLVDGHDRKGHDVTESSVTAQCRLAATLMAGVNADRHVLVSGSGYHVDADGESMEQLVAAILKSECGKPVDFMHKANVEIGWFRMCMRHKTGRSVVPYGRHTVPSRTKTWGMLNECLGAAHENRAPRTVHLYAFGHVHYWTRCEDAFGTVVTLPCWQAIGSRFGDAECDGHIDIGWAELFVAEEEGQWTLNAHIRPASVGESRWVKL